MRAFDLLAKAEADIRGSAQPRYHLEMALLRWIHLRKLVPISDLIQGLESAAPRTRPPPAPRRCHAQLNLRRVEPPRRQALHHRASRRRRRRRRSTAATAKATEARDTKVDTTRSTAMRRRTSGRSLPPT